MKIFNPPAGGQYLISNIQYPIFLFFILCSLLFAFTPVLANDQSLGQEISNQMNVAGQASGLSERDPRVIVSRFINYFLGVLGTIFIGYTVYAGYLWMTAGGEEEKTQLAKKHLLNAVIGLAIILAALGINLVVMTYLIRATSYQYYQPPLPYETIP